MVCYIALTWLQCFPLREFVRQPNQFVICSAAAQLSMCTIASSVVLLCVFYDSQFFLYFLFHFVRLAW